MKKYINNQYIFGRARLFINTAFLLLVSNTAFAQNITNPGFEIRTACPTHLGQIDLATGWSQPTGGTCDYFNTCGTQGVIFHTLTVTPHNGAGFAGGLAEYGGIGDYKEYITNTLSAPLIAGVTYTISFYIAQHVDTDINYSMIPIAERGYLGLCFSTTAPTQANTTGSGSGGGSIKNDFAPTGRTYIPANHPYYTSSNTWLPVTLKYTATGGEWYMTFGQFRPGNTSNGASQNYFYIDDFSETVAPNATLTKSVSPSSISSGGTATYTFTVANTTSGNIAHTGLSFTDALPSGLRIAATPNVVVTGLTGGTVSASAGGTSVAASGYSIAANTTATITVNVTNASGQLNASCGSNPAAFTNSATNISNLSANLTNSVIPVCLVVTAACNAGTVAPAVQNRSNICPATTVNLDLAHTGTIPSGTNLVWFNNNLHSGTALTAAQIANAGAGTYYAFYQSTTVANCFSPASNAVTVTINSCPPPTISSITPATQSVCQGATPAAITVSATGNGTLNYQWYFNTDGSTTTGTAIPGATSASYTPPASSTVGTTYYAPVVTDANGSTTSPLATVNVTGRPATPVVSTTTLSNVCPVTTADLTTLQPAAVSGQTYEWHTSASNPNAGTLIASPNAVSVNGVYYLYSKATSGGCYSAASNAVTVTINSCATCGSSGNNFVNLNSRFSGTTPNASVQLQWWKTANRSPGTQEMNPTNVTVSGTYYAFFYDTTNTCWNTTNSTSAVTVNILPLCSCTKPGDFSSAGSITKIGITVQQKQSGWPENVPNGFMALDSKEKGFVITRVQNSGVITDPKMGMLIYDKDANCVKLYNGSSWKCITKSCNTP